MSRTTFPGRNLKPGLVPFRRLVKRAFGAQVIEPNLSEP
jgi:hypothetical protein